MGGAGTGTLLPCSLYMIMTFHVIVASFVLHAGSSTALLLSMTTLPSAGDTLTAALGCCAGTLLCINALTGIRVREGALPEASVLGYPCCWGKIPLVAVAAALLQCCCLCLLALSPRGRTYGGPRDVMLISGMGTASAVLTAGMAVRGVVVLASPNNSRISNYINKLSLITILIKQYQIHI